MSGFEVIGVLLGVYPVVIDGLKLCKAVTSGQGIRLLVDDLTDEQLRYTESLGQLFGIEFVNEAQAHQKGTQTQLSYPTPRQQASLERRLGQDRAELIFSTLEGMKNVLYEMQRDIEKAQAGKGLEVGYYEKASMSIRQFKFIRRKSTFRDRLLQLKKWNDRLHYHLNSQSLPGNTGSGRKITPLISFPRQKTFVMDIYDAIHNGYQCLCDTPHSARLGLPDLSASTRRHALAGNQDDSFKLIFPFEGFSEGDSHSITPTVKDESPKDVQSTQSPEDLAEKSTRRLSITSSTVTMSMTTTSSSSKSKISSSRFLAIKECPDVGIAQIEDLCKTVRELDGGGEQERVGVLSSRGKRYELRRTISEKEASSFEETIDLEDLLTCYRDTLFRSYRFGLALRLSYAVLQFYATPWIEPNWSWRDFTVAMNGDRPNKDDPLFINHNFYSTRRQVVESKAEATRSFAFWAGVGEETLTRLGFALIELGLGRRLSELRQDGSIQADPRMAMTTDQDILNFWTAEGVLDSGLLFHEQGEDYEEVVRVLIKHEFEENCQKKLLSSRKPSFYSDVERLVIAPLYSRFTDSWERRSSQLSF